MMNYSKSPWQLLLAVPFLLFFLSCADSPEVRSDHRGQARHPRGRKDKKPFPTPETENRETASQPPVKARPPFRAPAMVGSMDKLVSEYRFVFDNLGKAPGTDEGLSVDERLPYLKQNLAQLLNANASKLTLLTNPETESGWFADVAVVASKDGDGYFIDREGKWFGAKLKDRVIGGVYTDDDGRKHLLTVFYGALTGTDFYRAFLGTTKLKILSFNLDRQNDGSITGKLRYPNGKVAIISRNGRDNSKVTVDGKAVAPLFQ